MGIGKGFLSYKKYHWRGFLLSILENEEACKLGERRGELERTKSERTEIRHRGAKWWRGKNKP